MSVGDNIEFALRVRGVRAAERRARRRELLRLVSLEDFDERLPAQLSGGQQQRVAVARALAHRPKVLLMDEPFGALDAKIREELRRTIRAIQRELGITTILVTHDQEEAFAMADRIGVMHQGRLLECGNPDELYSQPTTRFVSTFLGAANVMLGYRSGSGVRFQWPSAPVTTPGTPPEEVVTVLRPEEIEIAAQGAELRSTFIGQAQVEEILFAGPVERLRVRLLDGDALPAGLGLLRAGDESAVLEASRTLPEQRQLPVHIGQRIAIGARRVHVLPTPISSFCVLAAGSGDQDRLLASPLLEALAARMRTRVTSRHAPTLADTVVGMPAGWPAPPGVAVVESGVGNAVRVEWLLRSGARQVLSLPPGHALPQRLIVTALAPTARRATLAVAASLLRHLPAEALYVDVQPASLNDTGRNDALRELLDTRAEATDTHGFDVRTELRGGEVGAELAREIGDGPPAMIVAGLAAADPDDAIEALKPLEDLLSIDARCPVLIVRSTLVEPEFDTTATGQLDLAYALAAVR
jgi:sulfate transport system ATP-binding protein